MNLHFLKLTIPSKAGKELFLGTNLAELFKTGYF